MFAVLLRRYRSTFTLLFVIVHFILTLIKGIFMAGVSIHLNKTLTILLCSAALAGCSGPGTTAQESDSSADIVVVNHGLPADEAAVAEQETTLAPKALNADETVMVQAPQQEIEPPPLQEGVPQPLEPEQPAEVVSQVEEVDRLAALEKEVAELKAHYNAMMPAFNGLITTNERIQSLLAELEKKVGVPHSKPSEKADIPQPKQVDDAAIKMLPTDLVSIAPVQEGGPVVSDLRLGQHKDKMRVVIDVSASTKFTTAQTGNSILVSLPEAGWEGKPGVKDLSYPLIEGWFVQPGPKGGALVSVKVKDGAKIVAKEQLKPENGKPARIVIDVAAN